MQFFNSPAAFTIMIAAYILGAIFIVGHFISQGAYSRNHTFIYLGLACFCIGFFFYTGHKYVLMESIGSGGSVICSIFMVLCGIGAIVSLCMIGVDRPGFD